MKSKKYLLVILSILILLLFIGSASAADANETDVISIDESANLENNLLSVDNNEISNDALKASNDELLTAGNDWYVNSSKDSSGDGKSEGSAFKTVNESLNEAQDGDTIWIASGEYTGNENIGLTIAKNLNFIKYGDGEAIFDAEKSGRIWTVNSKSINIAGLTFKNGNSTNGSAIYISHEVKSNINATFINNTAEKQGGAIYIVSGGISGNLNGVFINNTASGWGGAIYIDSGGISGNVNGTFINNKGSSGAVIFIAGDISGNLNGTFINNTASGRGGAIYIYNGDASGNVNGTFINNVANDGGAIAVGESGKISGNVNGIFINNTGYHSGGAISIEDTEFYPTGKLDGIFINNEADKGGAIYIEFTYNDPNVSLGGTFINNKASRGGAIFINQLLAPITIQDSIFLNNSVVLSEGIGDYIKTIDCWFGNNATNYNIRPDAGNAVMDKWLFLNATANTTDVSVDENSIIAFKLESYDNSSGKVKPYDASKMKFSLDLTQTLGELDKNATIIGENITYTARQGGNASVTGKYETASYTIELNNVKIPTEINVTNSTIALNAGGEADVGATLTPADAGNLTYTSNNTNVVIVENGRIKSIKGGNATITVSFAGDGRYATAENKTISVIVSLNDASVVAENMELNVGESGVINYTTAPEGLKVSFVADNSGIVSVDEDGTVKALKNGTAAITLNVGDDEVYAKNSTVINVTVTLNDASVVAEDMELNVSDSGVINYTTSPDGLNVTFVADNSGVVSVDEDGTVKALKEGKANITVKVGDAKVYAENSTVITVTVSKIPTEINVNNHTLDFGIGDKADSVAELLPSDAGKLNFTSSDENVVVVDDNGTFTAVGEGNANVTVSFDGNYKFEAADSKTIYVTVTKIPTKIFVSNATVDMKVGDEVDPGVSITPSDAGELDYVSSDVSVVRVDGDGTFIGVGTGTANVTVSFYGNDKFEAAENKTIEVTVTLNDAGVAAEDMELNVGESGVIKYTTSPEGLNVTFVVDNSGVVSVDKNGKVTALKEGAANITVKVGGDGVYTENSTKITVAVSKIPTEIRIAAKTINIDIFNEVAAGATLVPNAGKLTYTSNNPSVASVVNGKIKGLKNGKATITVSFAGNDKYMAAESKTITVNVNKIKSQIVASNVKTTFKNSKKLVVKLADAKGKGLIDKKITVKFNNKVFTRTVDSKGCIVLTVSSKLAPKTYALSLSYAGDNTYLKSTKSVNVVVAKGTPTVIAKSKSFKLSAKNKYYTATLKYKGNIVKGAKMVLKFKTKIYFAKVGSNGKATFKITHLNKKARYTGLVGFLGNKYYNKAKSIRISVPIV